MNNHIADDEEGSKLNGNVPTEESLHFRMEIEVAHGFHS